MFQHRPFNKIVVPTDGSAWSERAIPYAVDFARISGGEVDLAAYFHTANARIRRFAGHRRRI